MFVVLSLCFTLSVINVVVWDFPGVLGSWGERSLIFRELRSTGNYFQGAGEQAFNFGELGSTFIMRLSSLLLSMGRKGIS